MNSTINTTGNKIWTRSKGFSSPNFKSTKINMWSDVFLHKTENIAMVLIQFESSFFSEKWISNVKWLAFENLLSSLQVMTLSYNTAMSNNCKAYHVATTIGEFVNKAQSEIKLSETDLNSPPKHLSLLISDFENESENCDSHKCSGKLKTNYEKIEEVFLRHKSVSCSFIPGYHNTAHQKHLKEFITSLFSPENLVDIKVDSDLIKGENFPEFFKKSFQPIDSLELSDQFETFEEFTENHFKKLAEKSIMSCEIFKAENDKESFYHFTNCTTSHFEQQKKWPLPANQDEMFRKKAEGFFKSHLNSSEANNETSDGSNGKRILEMIALQVVTLFIVCIFVLIACFAKKKFYSNDESPLTDCDDNIWQIDVSRVDLLFVIGKGNFGEVHKGVLSPLDDEVQQKNQTVAVKTLKFDNHLNMSDEEFIESRVDFENAFIQEARRMAKFNCHHIVKLLGFCIKEKPYMFVMEFMEQGDLKSFLAKNCLEISRNQIWYDAVYVNESQSVDLHSKREMRIPSLSCMALQIADGMAYLEAMRFVHRDLAARNCMVSADFTIKIADFGLTRFTDTSNYYMAQTGCELPYRWMAPESFTQRKYSSRSDVWSYGILLWELVTFAEKPYPVSEK